MVPPHRAAILDDRVSFEQAATLPIAGLTALRALRAGGSVVGRNVLVTGATGAVGHFAVQLAVLSGAYVTAQVRTPERDAQARALGAARVVTTLDDPSLGPFHLVLDGIGGPMLTGAIHRMAPEATAVVYGGSGGTTGLHLRDFSTQAWNGKVMGLISELPELTKGEDIALLARLVADGRLRPLIGWTRNWTQTPEAFEALARREIRGKAILLRT